MAAAESSEQRFKIGYYGFCEVVSHQGEEIVQAAIATLFARRKPQKVVVEVTKHALRVLDAKGNQIRHRTPAEEVTYCSINDGKSMVAFVEARENAMTGDYENQRCHVFLAKKCAKELKELIMKTYNITPARRVAALSRRGVADTAADSAAADAARSIVFEARYLGSVPVTQKSGQAVVEQALTYLRAQLQMTASEASAKAISGSNVTIVISKEGIRTLDSLTRAVVHNIFIRNIAFTTSMEKSGSHEIFGCITFDERLERSCCYVYNCVAGQASDICRKIHQAREKAEEESNSDNDPFEPLDEAVQGSMTKTDIDPKLLQKHIDRETLAAVKPIGLGQFGKVYLATTCNLDDDDEAGSAADSAAFKPNQVAVRMLRPAASAADCQDFLREAVMTMGFNHPNVLKLVGVSLLEHPWLEVFEFVQYGDLHSVLLGCKEKNVQLQAAEQLQLGLQIARGMEHVVSQGIVHMDLAARNCLLHTGNVVKISNFRMAKRHNPGTKYYVLRERLKLSLRWLAVETFIAEKKVFSEASDMWSFGVTLWEIFSYAATPYGMRRLNEVHHLVPRGLRLNKPESCPDVVFEEMVRCWAKNAPDRPSFAQMAECLASIHQTLEGAGAMRDVGQCLNSALHTKLSSLARTATQRHRRRTLMRRSTKFSRTSSLSSMGGASDGDAVESFNQDVKAITEGNVRRENPLFMAMQGGLGGLDGVEEEEEGSGDAQDSEGDAGWDSDQVAEEIAQVERNYARRISHGTAPRGAHVVGDYSRSPLASGMGGSMTNITRGPGRGDMNMPSSRMSLSAAPITRLHDSPFSSSPSSSPMGGRKSSLITQSFKSRASTGFVPAYARSEPPARTVLMVPEEDEEDGKSSRGSGVFVPKERQGSIDSLKINTEMFNI